LHLVFPDWNHINLLSQPSYSAPACTLSSLGLSLAFV
jgi:hypothetical protein